MKIPSISEADALAYKLEHESEGLQTRAKRWPGPYEARPLTVDSPYATWYVSDRNGINIGVFDSSTVCWRLADVLNETCA